VTEPETDVIRELSGTLGQLTGEVRAMNEKVDVVVQEIFGVPGDSKLIGQRGRVQDHEARIVAIESADKRVRGRLWSIIQGALLALIGAGVTALIAHIAWK
jgi:hypothetical protein